MKAKLSPWFEPTDKPVRAGVYQRLYDDWEHPGSVVYCLWNGNEWFISAPTKKAAAKQYLSSGLNRRWRGIVK